MMLFAWLGKKALFGLARGWWVLLGIVAIAGLVLWLTAREEADDKANQQIGADRVVIETQGKALEQVEKANEAREEIGRAGPAGDRLRYDQCLRSARTPANCERYAVPE